MWIIVKTKKNCVVKNLKANLKKLFSIEPLYIHQNLQQNIVGNKFKEKLLYIWKSHNYIS